MFAQTHHFRRFASGETYSLNRFTKETHRLYRVLDRQLEAHHYVAGSNYGIADIAVYPWVDRFELHDISLESFPNVKRWRSAERRVGKECVRTCRSRWSPDH